MCAGLYAKLGSCLRYSNAVKNLVLLFGVILIGYSAAVAQTPPPCASPAAAAAADALAAKFDTHQFVLIGSTHGDAKIDQFLTCLVSRPAFKQRVTDIVVEWASSSLDNQHLLDRYVLTLDEIPVNDLAPVWFDTDAPTMWTTLPPTSHHVRNDHV